MKLAIRATNFPLTPALESFIQDQVGETMVTYSHRISKIKVSLKNVEQVNGTVDAQCCVEVRVKGLQTAVVIKRNYDIHDTIRQSVSQAGQAVVRLLEKQQYDRYSRSIGRISFNKNRLHPLAA